MTGSRGDGSSRAGRARTGYTRLGWTPPVPDTRAGIRAVAEYLAGKRTGDEAARCGVARCGYTRLGASGSTQVYAGQYPQVCTAYVTLALTELPGGPAVPRQEYAEAYDNPAYTLHIIGEDLQRLDEVAQEIRAGADRTAHITTQYGIINGISIGPPQRTVRGARPRYDVQMTVDAEIIREHLQEA